MVIDLLFFCIAGIGFIVGYRQGVIKLVLTVFSAFIGFLLTIRFTPNMHQFLLEFFDGMDSVLMPVLAFIFTFIVSMVFIRLAAQIVETFFKTSNLGEFNQIAGGALLGILGLFLYSGVIWFLMKADILEDFTLDERAKMELLRTELDAKGWEDSRALELYPTEQELLEWNMSEEEFQKLGKAISKRKESRTLPLINTFLFQFDIFMVKTAEMFNELFKDIKMVWEPDSKQ